MIFYYLSILDTAPAASSGAKGDGYKPQTKQTPGMIKTVINL